MSQHRRSVRPRLLPAWVRPLRHMFRRGSRPESRTPSRRAFPLGPPLDDRTGIRRAFSLGRRLESGMGARDSAGPAGRRVRWSVAAEAGMATAEYAIATLAAVGFAGLLVVILRSDAVRELLLGIVVRALSL